MFAIHGVLASSSSDEADGISLVGTSSGGGITTLPAGLQENDHVVVQIASDDYDVNSVSGWTTIQTRLSSARGVLVAKRMGPTPDTSIVVDARCAVVCMAFRGVDITIAEDVTHQSLSGFGAPNPPAITPITNGCAIVISASLDDQEAAGSMVAPTGFGDLVVSDEGSQNATAMMAWQRQTTASMVNPGAFSGSSDDNWTTTQALRPQK